ncbi:hypothetical protein [Streptomyces sp. cg36]|uniref:hypothetical protein n=1 Tax=Streptomyces sp. cg36 TaxID=3238798 RepID=UPI0034E2BA00
MLQTKIDRVLRDVPLKSLDAGTLSWGHIRCSVGEPTTEHRQLHFADGSVIEAGLDDGVGVRHLHRPAGTADGRRVGRIRPA